MKILSWNVNGLRAANKKGFFKWFKKENPDILCLQEIKAHKEQLPNELQRPSGYHVYFNEAKKKGYSGVLVYSKVKPRRVYRKIQLSKFDNEGRYLKLDFEKFSLINIYIPHGGRQKENMKYKLRTYNLLLKKLNRSWKRKTILIGDLNVAHHEIDLARSKQNINNTMFTLGERDQINQIVKAGFTDSFRKHNQLGGNYTWWPYGFDARKRNIGWRIDYIFSSKEITPLVKSASIYKNIKGSDHCPIGIELNLKV